ncbi:GTP-binding protein Di-Ras2-like [Thrips palmi]|uniref:GTP-binding protein Di-Ras2-like n=1 Tax=Thrips palmi TaxID=161013 RepID=A0A6P8ZML7_THRPL|nr:GTP-binding protein Di-Ras2-like [Thrips palmi]
MPGPCERLRLPSVGSSEPSGSSLQKEQHKVVVMGAARVGKSSIIAQFLYDKYLEKYRETVEEFHHAEYSLPDGASLTLDILDTSGAFSFPAMRALSIKKANAFILVFAIDDARSWEEVANLRQQILEAREPRVPIVVVGNKVDLDEALENQGQARPIKREITETTARLDWECGYIECSAKGNEGIIDVFKELLNVSKVRYNLSPAVRRRRQSLPNYVGGGGSSSAAAKAKHMLKRNSCAVA